MALPAAADVYTVTNFNDSGPGSLRQGILDANSGACPNPCTITFQRNLPAAARIDLQSPLPTITARHQLTITPYQPGQSFGPGKVLINGIGAGPAADGLRIEDASFVKILGLEINGFSRHGIIVVRSGAVDIFCDSVNNGDNGIALVDTVNVRIFGVKIGGNRSNGIYAARSQAVDIGSCLIGGTDRNHPMPNGGNGIHLHDVRDSHGSFNSIWHNAYTGLLITGQSTRNDFEYNRFLRNGLLGIDIGGDGVTPDNAPVIESASYNRGIVRVVGRLHAAPNSKLRIQLYQLDEPDPSGYGEGLDYLSLFASFEQSQVKTDANGEARFTHYLPSFGTLRNTYLTAIATLFTDGFFGQGQTSEFSRTVKVSDDEVEFVVSNTADSGAGSLRNAIEESNLRSECATNYPCVITFRIAEPPPANGVFTIRPKSPLPAIQHSGIWLDGATQRMFAGDSNPAGPEIEINGSLCEGCNGLEVRPGETRVDQVLIREVAINGFSNHGIFVSGPDLKLTATAYINGCYIGTDSTGTRAVPNGGSGIRVQNAFAVMGSLFYSYLTLPTAAPNIISGNNRDGVTLASSGFIGVFRNLIGTDISTLYPIANGENGIRTEAGARLDGNIIAFNRDRGVVIARPDNGVNMLFSNHIHSNGSLGIDIFGDDVTENGRPGIQNAPEIISARAEGDVTRVIAKLDSPLLEGCCTTYLVTFYNGSFADASGRGEGRNPVFSTYLDGGNKEVELVIKANMAGKFLAATAMKFHRFEEVGVGTVSEFSRAVQITSDACSTIAPSLNDPNGNKFSWSAVPGAALYIVWSMKPGDMPRAIFQGTATEATLPLDAGRYERWVEARFEGCYGTQSEHRFVTVP